MSTETGAPPRPVHDRLLPARDPRGAAPPRAQQLSEHKTLREKLLRKLSTERLDRHTNKPSRPASHHEKPAAHQPPPTKSSSQPATQPPPSQSHSTKPRLQPEHSAKVHQNPPRPGHEKPPDRLKPSHPAQQSQHKSAQLKPPQPSAAPRKPQPQHPSSSTPPQQRPSKPVSKDLPPPQPRPSSSHPGAPKCHAPGLRDASDCGKMLEKLLRYCRSTDLHFPKHSGPKAVRRLVMRAALDLDIVQPQWLDKHRNTLRPLVWVDGDEPKRFQRFCDLVVLMAKQQRVRLRPDYPDRLRALAAQHDPEAVPTGSLRKRSRDPKAVPEGPSRKRSHDPEAVPEGPPRKRSRDPEAVPEGPPRKRSRDPEAVPEGPSRKRSHEPSPVLAPAVHSDPPPTRVRAFAEAASPVPKGPSRKRSHEPSPVRSSDLPAARVRAFAPQRDPEAASPVPSSVPEGLSRKRTHEPSPLRAPPVRSDPPPTAGEESKQSEEPTPGSQSPALVLTAQYRKYQDPGLEYNIDEWDEDYFKMCEEVEELQVATPESTLLSLNPCSPLTFDPDVVSHSILLPSVDAHCSPIELESGVVNHDKMFNIDLDDGKSSESNVGLNKDKSCEINNELDPVTSREINVELDKCESSEVELDTIISSEIIELDRSLSRECDGIEILTSLCKEHDSGVAQAVEIPIQPESEPQCQINATSVNISNCFSRISTFRSMLIDICQNHSLRKQGCLV